MENLKPARPGDLRTRLEALEEQVIELIARIKALEEPAPDPIARIKAPEEPAPDPAAVEIGSQET